MTSYIIYDNLVYSIKFIKTEVGDNFNYIVKEKKSIVLQLLQR
jgi:hypothetical protein